MKVKDLKREFVQLMIPVITNLVKYGTPEFEETFHFYHEAEPFTVWHKVEGPNLLVTISSWHGVSPRFFYPIKYDPTIAPELLAKQFVDMNSHILDMALKSIKKRTLH